MITTLFADQDNQIYDHPILEFSGRLGRNFIKIPENKCIPLPDGSQIFSFPGRLPIGWEKKSNKFILMPDTSELFETSKPVQAVTAFLPPGYLRLYLPAYERKVDAPVLPLWAYGAVGWDTEKENYVVPAIKVDYMSYWQPEAFDDRELLPKVRKKLSENKNNRLLQHLSHCATGYHCFAAKNLFLERGEAPLPIAPACNAECIGCLSLQQAEGCPASHDRINFIPTSDEICEIAIPHLKSNPDSIVSFGQGCEGDPILYADTIIESVRKMRSATDQGTINLNTNGSRPDVIPALAKAGLDSIRISMNAVDQYLYCRYYRPINYQYEDIIKSLKLSVDNGIHTAINWLIFPGVNDMPSEFKGLVKLIKNTGIHLLQLRNLNIDPDLYLEAIGEPAEPSIGLVKYLKKLHTTLPDLTFGYFNKPKKDFGKPTPLEI